MLKTIVFFSNVPVFVWLELLISCFVTACRKTDFYE